MERSSRYAARHHTVSETGENGGKHGDDTPLSPFAVSKGGESKKRNSVPDEDIATG